MLIISDFSPKKPSDKYVTKFKFFSLSNRHIPGSNILPNSSSIES